MDDDYKSPIPQKLRWRAWAKDAEGLTGEQLLDFINNDLFRKLKELPAGGKNAALAGVVRGVFEDAFNYMKSGTLLRQVVNKLEEIDFNKASDRHEFTYTHRPLRAADEREAVRAANEAGFTINLSADGLHEVDRLVALGIGPVVVNLPHDEPASRTTPAGHRIVVCPAEAPPARDGTPPTTCLRCKLCAKPDRTRIVGFLTHGSGQNFAAMVAKGMCGDRGMPRASIDGPEVER